MTSAGIGTSAVPPPPAEQPAINAAPIHDPSTIRRLAVRERSLAIIGSVLRFFGNPIPEETVGLRDVQSVSSG
ncbi:hypothetical protein [Candidatus Palauibacter sp.]|uniref:hypothetical protein n=1 Tax=Candidatus Palauibacter sp. TaxID=3101350 RepID=UPI003B01B219